MPEPPTSTLFPYTTLFRSGDNKEGWDNIDIFGWLGYPMQIKVDFLCRDSILAAPNVLDLALFFDLAGRAGDRKSTRLNSSHRCISYAVFCLKKKKQHDTLP